MDTLIRTRFSRSRVLLRVEQLPIVKLSQETGMELFFTRKTNSCVIFLYGVKRYENRCLGKCLLFPGADKTKEQTNKWGVRGGGQVCSQQCCHPVCLPDLCVETGTAGEVARQLQTLPALVGDPGLVASTHV